jgi:hypothetical protein
MKKIFAALLFSCIGYSLHAQISVEKITLKGTTYTVTRNIPDDLKVIFGVYTYEWGNEDEKAIVQLNEDGTGLFQPHMINPIRIQFWFDCDENGIVRKKEGVNGNYSVTLLLQYGESPNKNYATGSYDLMGVIVVPIENYAVIYGERYKKIH